jgi:hypothetical protein
MFTAWRVTACNVATFTPSTWGCGGGSCHITSCNCPPKGHYAMWRGITWHNHRTITSHERRHRDVHCRACSIVVVVAIVVGSFNFLCRKKILCRSPKLRNQSWTHRPSLAKRKIKIWKGKEKNEARNLQLNYLLREIFAKVVSMNLRWNRTDTHIPIWSAILWLLTLEAWPEDNMKIENM